MLDFITGLIGTILYPLFSIIFVLVDILQAIFRTFAGVGGAGYGDTLWNIQNITTGNSGTETDTGLVFFLLNTPLVKNMLISIMVLGLFLLIIFTVMAFIKNAYSAKQKGWKEIVGNAIKGLANFIFLPVCCLLGIWLGNILLNAIDGATSSGGSTLMSRKLFIAAAYNANFYRNGKADDTDSTRVLRWVYEYAEGANIISSGDMPFDKSAITENLTNEQMAEMVDQIYASGAMNIYTHDGAGQGYSLYQINYLTLIIGGVFMLYVLISLAYGMIRRMFILLMLYIISPALCAMYPIDEGKAAGSWKSDFIKQTISAYGAVAGMNLFFSLLPLVNNIQLFGGYSGDSFGDVMISILVAVNNIIGIDTIIQLLIMVSGLFVVKEFISMISGYIGAEDAYSKGAALRKQAVDATKKYGKPVVKKAATYAFGGIDAYKKKRFDADGNVQSGRISSFFSGLGGTAKTAVKEGGKDAAQKFLGLDFNRMSGIKDKEGFKDMLKNATWMEDINAGEKVYKDITKKAKQIKELEDYMSQYRFYNDMQKSTSGKTYGWTDKNGKKHRMSAEDRMSQMQDLESIIASYASRLGFADAGLEKVSKDSKIPLEILKTNIESGGTLKKSRKAWESAEKDRDVVEDKLKDIISDPTSSKGVKAIDNLGKLFNSDLNDLASKLSLSIQDLARRLQTGLKVEVNDKKADGSDRYSEEQKAFGQELNNIIEKQQSKRDKVEEMKQAFMDVAASTKMSDAAGREVKLADADLEKLANMSARDIAGSGLLDQFDKLSTKLSKSGKEELALLEDIRKAIADAKAKADKDKK